MSIVAHDQLTSLPFLLLEGEFFFSSVRLFRRIIYQQTVKVTTVHPIHPNERIRATVFFPSAVLMINQVISPKPCPCSLTILSSKKYFITVSLVFKTKIELARCKVDMDLSYSFPPSLWYNQKKSHLSYAVVRGLWVSHPGMDDISLR